MDKTKHTKTSSFRIPERILTPAKAKAEAENRTLTDVIVDALREYIRP